MKTVIVITDESENNYKIGIKKSRVVFDYSACKVQSLFEQLSKSNYLTTDTCLVSTLSPILNVMKYAPEFRFILLVLSWIGVTTPALA